MGFNDRMDEDDGFSDFLNEILDCLDGTAKGITKLVIDKGDGILSDKQKFVFEKEVLDIYTFDECVGCGSNIPWSEMYAAYDNGGYCGYCENRRAKIEKE
ncbi:MAG: hypothetical protein GY737_11275 [Desulfobacteraceae bacterium]|nr:hypothetical protein [Desulfobacteraceae bacterium]